MILIISDEIDSSTNDVIDWLSHWHIPYIRLNEEDGIRIQEIKISNDSFDILFEVQKIFPAQRIRFWNGQIDSYWYRRGRITLFANMPQKNSSHMSEIYNDLYAYLQREDMKIVDLIHNYLAKIPHINSFCDNLSINKLSVLYEAHRCQMAIPETFIVQDKETLISVLNPQKKYVIKGIDRNGFGIKDRFSVGNLTKVLTTKMINQLPSTFNYSLVQEYINKKADIRVFYLNKTIFSAAIFSQNDPKTKIDFRNYNDSRPNRIIPYALNEKSKYKLIKLMDILGYNSGSIDYVLDYNNRLYFLEINPIGQYGFISKQCNYHLDYLIAYKLKMDYERRTNDKRNKKNI